jgi:hypothetical protein
MTGVEAANPDWPNRNAGTFLAMPGPSVVAIQTWDKQAMDEEPGTDQVQ